MSHVPAKSGATHGSLDQIVAQGTAWIIIAKGIRDVAVRKRCAASGREAVRGFVGVSGAVEYDQPRFLLNFVEYLDMRCHYMVRQVGSLPDVFHR
jgi:hypothetical protein